MTLTLRTAAVLALWGLARAVPPCPFAVDLVLLQDLTGSLGSLGSLQRKAASMVNALNAGYPGSRVGIVSFTDIPVRILGTEEDSCVSVEQPLTSDALLVALAASSYVRGNGNDHPEAQLMAMQHALLNDDVGWRPNGAFTEGGLPVLNAIVLVTDSHYHTAGDGLLHGLDENDGNDSVECGLGGEDYPTLAQVTTAFDLRDAVLISLVTGDGTATVYEEFLANTIGSNRGSVSPLASNSSNFMPAITRALDGLAEEICSRITPCPEQHALEIVYVQDLSRSMDAHLAGLKDAVPSAFIEVQAAYPHTTVALASFTDKPVPPLGHPVSHDYCFRLHHSLSWGGGDLADGFEDFSSHSGGDWKEAVMDALFQVATDPAVGFTTGLVDAANRTVHRAIVVSTDAEAHVAGDGMANGLTPHDGKPGLDCKAEDYPSVMQVGAALASIGKTPTRVAFAVPTALAASYSAIALQWGAQEVVADIFAGESPVTASLEAVHFALDPCRTRPTPATGLSREETLFRALSASGGTPQMAVQDPVEISFDERKSRAPQCAAFEA